MGALIDSSVFMAAERGLCDLEAELTKRLGDWMGMAAITASEMLAGVAWPNRPADKRQASEVVAGLRNRDRPVGLQAGSSTWRLRPAPSVGIEAGRRVRRGSTRP